MPEQATAPAGRQYVFRASWELDEEGLDMTREALKREAMRGPLQDLLAKAGAQLLCEPAQMSWRIDEDLNLVAEGPARPWVDRDVTTWGRAQAAAAAA